MGKIADLELWYGPGNWWWRLRFRPSPKAYIQGEMMNYTSEATAARAAVKVAVTFSLIIRHTFINGVKQK